MGNGWEVYANGNKVTFIAFNAETRTGTYVFATGGTGMVIDSGETVTQELAGVAQTDSWIAQTNWNVDKANGDAQLPVIDVTKGNVYRITYQWLGFGSIYFFIENPQTGEFVKVHEIQYSNSATTTSIQNPKLPLCCHVRNMGNTTSLTLQVPSMVALLSGQPPLEHPAVHAVSGTQTINAADFTTIISLRNTLVVTDADSNKIFNTVNAVLTNCALFNNSGKTAEFRLYRNPTLEGSIAWTSAGTIIESSNDIATIDTTDTSQVLLYSLYISSGSSAILNESDVKELIRPGDVITVCAQLTATPVSNDIGVSLRWYEDF